MKKVLIPVLLLLALGMSARGQQPLPLYMRTDAPLEERVEDALQRLTLEEKVALCHAQSKFTPPGLARLGIREQMQSDGPHGVRAEPARNSRKIIRPAFHRFARLATRANPKLLCAMFMPKTQPQLPKLPRLSAVP